MRSPTLTTSLIGPRKADWLLLALLILTAVFSRLCYLVRPFDSDGAMFIYMGRLVAEGGRFGQDLVDNKFPTVGLMTSAPWRLFGPHWGPYVVLGMAMSILSTVALARSMTRNIGHQAGRATLLAGLAYFNFTPAVFGGFQLETIQVLFTSFAAASALDALRRESLPDAFVIGLCAATAGLLKPTGMLIAPAFFLAILMYASGWRAVLKLAGGLLCGALVPMSVAVVYLHAVDNLRDIPALSRQISRYAANSAWDWPDLIKPVIVIAIAGFPLLVRGYIFRHDRADVSSTPASSKPIWTFLLFWVAFEAVGVAVQRRMYAYHFMVLAPALTLMFGLLPRPARMRSLAAALVPLAAFSVYAAMLTITLGANPATLAASDYLRQHAAPGDRVWKDDAPRLLLETGLHCASRYPLTFLFANYDTAPLEYGNAILQDFARTQPQYVVLRSDLAGYVTHQRNNILELERFPVRSRNYQLAWDRIAAYVHQNYFVEASIDHQDVWRRRDPFVASATITD